MKLSPQTVTILQNFQTINSSIVIKEGNVIKTIAPTESIFAKAIVSDEFPRTFGIFELSKFLGILSLNKASELDFKDDHVVITQGKSKVKYGYCDPSLIVAPPDKDIKLGTPEVMFELSPEAIQSVMKAMQILGFSELEIKGEEGNLSLGTVNTKNSGSNIYSTDIGETSKTFSAIIEADKLKLIPSVYTVSISSRGLAHFKCNEVEYWIALSTKSKFE